MADDGDGYRVQIPTIIMDYEQGRAIASFMRANPGHRVTVTVHFGTHMRDELDLLLFLSNADRHSAVLLRELEPLYRTIAAQARLTPFWETFACPQCREEDCVQNRTYCAVPPPLARATGKDLILQMLRQHFVFETRPQAWFAYMGLVDQFCEEASRACSDLQLKSLGVDAGRVEALAVEEMSRPAGVLRDSRLARIRAGVNVVPDAVVNSVAYHGELQAVDIYELACNSLNAPPAACNPFLNDPSRLVPDLNHKKALLFIALAVFALLLLLAFCIFCVYRRVLRRQISHDITRQINSLVGQYVQLYEDRK